MSYSIERTDWSQWYRPDYRHGWVGEPDQGTELGRVSVVARIPRGTTHKFLGFDFYGTLTFIKEVYHKADPIYIVRFTAGEKLLTEDQVPDDILEAFENIEEDDEYTRKTDGVDWL